MDGRLNLWVDDSALHSFEVCTETVDDGVTAFFLEATHVHASDFDPSVCNSVVVLSVSHVDASEMASSSVVPRGDLCDIVRRLIESKSGYWSFRLLCDEGLRRGLFFPPPRGNGPCPSSRRSFPETLSATSVSIPRRMFALSQIQYHSRDPPPPS